MEEFLRWLTGIVVALLGMGAAMFYQGRALRNPEQARAAGRNLWAVGIVFMLMGSVYLLAVLLLFALNR